MKKKKLPEIEIKEEYLVEEYLADGSLEIVFSDYKLPEITFGVYYNYDLLNPASKAFLTYLKD